MKRPDDNIIAQFITGNCSEENLREVNNWMLESKDNQNEVFEMEELLFDMKSAAINEERKQAALSRVLSRVKEEKERERHSRRLHRIIYAVAASVAVLVIGLGIMWHTHAMGLSEKMLVAQAPADSTIQITLSDGTKVWLNDGASLKYPEKFSDELRQVELDGEGYFEVAKNKLKPFVVESKAMSVKVLGTKFNFSNSIDGHYAAVSLIEGSVDVKSNIAPGEVLLSPGQKAEIDNATGSLKVSEVETVLDAVWHDDVIPFNNASIRSIAHTLEYVYGVTIVVDSDLDRYTTYSGVIERKNTIDNVLHLLKNTIPFDYHIDGKTVEIKKQINN